MKAAKLPPGPATPLERALKMIRGEASLNILSTLTRNVAQNPREEKYRKLRLTNAKISEAITTVEGAMAALAVLGWVQDGEEFLVLPESVQLTMAHVRTIEAAKEAFEKEAREAAKRRMHANSNKSSDPEKERLRQQLAADKAERASRGPVTQGSKAVSLGQGANVMTAGELGINKPPAG